MESQQDPIRFRNLLVKARDSLALQGMRLADVKTFLQPVADLLEDPELWRNSEDGLAVFCAPGLFRYYRLHTCLEEMVSVGDRFIISPLLRTLSRHRIFHLLSLNLKHVQLFQCTQDSISEIALRGAPTSLDESLQAYTMEESRRFHSVSARRGGRPVGITNGQGAGSDDAVRKRYIQQFFIQVDRAVSKLLTPERSPLVLAGVKYLCALYRESNSYGGLIPQDVPGSTTLENAKDLHTKAWQVMEPCFAQAQEMAVARYKELAGTSMASSELEKIMPAAYNGLIQTLLVPQGLHTWGTYDAATQKVEIHPVQKPGQEDLLDIAAANTLLHGGDIITIGSAATGGAVAAVFRY